MNREYGMTSLNGWTAPRLDALAADVADIKHTLQEMQNDEIKMLRAEVRDARDRPRKQLSAFVIPLLCACIPGIIVVVAHAA